MTASSDLTTELLETEIKALSLPSKCGLVVEFMFSARNLEDATEKLFNLETHAYSMTFDGVKHFQADQSLRKGDCAFFRIVQSRVIHAPLPYVRTLLRCAVPGCKAECEFRGLVPEGEAIDARDRPGVLVARPAQKPVAEFLNGKSYVIAGQFQEHYHVIDASIKRVPHSVKRKIEHFIDSQPVSQVHELSSETLIDLSLAGLEPVTALVSRSALVIASGHLLQRPRCDLGIFSPQTTAASSQIDRLLDTEPVKEGSMIVPGILQQPLTDPVSEDIRSIEGRLFRLGVVYVKELGVFYCTMCKFYIRDTFATHSQKQHQVKIPGDLLKEAQQSLPISDLPIPENDCVEAIDPLPHLPVKDGFACSSCGFCLGDSKNMRAHIIKNHGKSAATPIACFVQCPFSGPAHRLVRVKKKIESVPDSSAVIPMISEDAIGLFFDKSCRDIEQKQKQQPPDTDNARNPLYQDISWFHTRELEYLLTQNLASYFEGVFESEKVITDIMIEILSSVREADVTVRYGVNGNANGTVKILKKV